MARIASLMLLALLACASGSRRWTSSAGRSARDGARAATVDFPPGQGDPMMRELVRALRARGFELAACDAGRAMARITFDAPCGGSTCLAREAAEIRVGHYRAKVTLRRELWSATTHTWEPTEGGDAAAVERDARALAEGALAGARAAGRARIDPCLPEPCGPGRACQARN